MKLYHILQRKHLNSIHLIYVIIVLVNVLDKSTTNAFNLSPKPNIVLREPISQSKHAMPKMRSSYFGFSLNLKQNSVIIGAPRAQSTLDVQRRINETGAIYKCTFDQTQDENTCFPFVFDPWGNIPGSMNQFVYDSEKKDYQWLGAAMDGSASDSDKLVVCAPRLVGDIPRHYLMHGVCYWTSNTTTNRPVDVQKIASLRLKDKQNSQVNGEQFFYYMFGEQGMSVHITEDNEEILIGAPGIFTWKGSVVRYRAKISEDFGGLSRRDEDHSSFPRRRQQSEIIEYGSDIPNPLSWNQDDNSYFGFAISSGYFDGPQSMKLLYVATAPQANAQQGEAYIFDIVDFQSTSDKTIKIYYKFAGQQFGEYFGYSVIAEDFDGDGFTDIAIGAPFNAKDGTNENGAVYIYRNHGSASRFELDKVLRTDYELGGRLGTTMSRIGDVNQDGFKDLLVAAPFEENGAVYIYLGSANGLSSKPSQRIATSSIPGTIEQPSHMFGHGLSKGADIDGNQYLDIAVGAPNAEKVYIFKSYPVVRINTKIIPFNNEIKTNDRSFKFNMCWSYESKYAINFDVRFNGTITLDGQLGRATFRDKRNQYSFEKRLTPQEQCMELEALVEFSVADIFKPIDIDLVHSLVNGIPNNALDTNEAEDFCETCVAVNPSDSKNVKNKIVFSTGCKGSRCIADLSVRSVLNNVVRPYVLGSTTSIPIEYRVENNGETAYLAQIEITLPDTGVAFMKIPSNCKLNETAVNQNVMLCDLNSGTPMFNGDKTSLQVNIDTTKLDGSELIIKALAKSASDESNESNNRADDVIALKSFSEIEVFGDSLKRSIALGEESDAVSLTHTFEIRNNGPSNIKSLDVFISVPTSYLSPWSLERVELIDPSSLSIKAMHKNQQFRVEWTQNNTILILDAIETTTPALSTAPIADYNGMQYDTSRIGLEYDLNGNTGEETNTNAAEGRRRRRSALYEADAGDAYYNLYSQSVVENNQMDTFSWREMPAFNRRKRDIFNTDDKVLANLPVNRTIYFECQDEEQDRCLVGKFSVPDFMTDNSPIMITLNFTVSLDRLANILSEKRDIFVIRTMTDFSETSEEDTSRIHVTQNYPFTIISKYVITETPLWVYIISIIIGVLSLILLSYALYRFGFFNRGKRDELVKLKRQSQAASYYPNEEDDLY